jgi:hypothetical protein
MVASLPNYDASTVLAAMRKPDLPAQQAPVYGGWTVKGATSPLRGFPQLLHTEVQAGVIKNGVIVSTGGLFDPFKDLASYKATH